MKKLYALSLLLFLTNTLCRASGDDGKLAVIAAVVGIPIVLYAGNHLMHYLKYKLQLVASNNDHANPDAVHFIAMILS